MRQTIAYNYQELKYLAKLNPWHRSAEPALLEFFEYIKQVWSPSALRAFKEETGLKLNSNLKRCEFARLAAVKELQQLPTDSDRVSQDLDTLLVQMRHQLAAARQKAEQLELDLQSEQKKLTATESLNCLLITHRLLPPGEPLNGTQDSSAMRILGSPKTLTELEANYRELIKREHPDVSVHPPEVAKARFTYLRSLYQFTRRSWNRLKPTASVTPQELEQRLQAPTPFNPASFWPS